MSLKAGRVGVNSADVNPIDGRINPSLQELNASTTEEYLDFTTEYSDKLENYYNKVVKKGNLVIVSFSFDALTVGAYGALLTVPASCKPKNTINCIILTGNTSITGGYVDTDGVIRTRSAISSGVARACVVYAIEK